MEKMKFRTPPQGRIDRPYYNQDQATKLWRTSKDMGAKYHALIAVNLGMGLRQIGAYRLAWKNIDLQNRKAKVIGKATKPRTLVIPIRVKQILETWKIEQKKLGKKLAKKARWVFTKDNLERPGKKEPRPKTLGDWLNRILDKAGVPHLDGFRAGRRRFGRDLYIATNYNIVAVSEYLGHESTDITKIYLQLEEHDQRKIIDQLDQMDQKIQKLEITE
jgi:integrase